MVASSTSASTTLSSSSFSASKRRYFAQLFRCLLEHLDLFAKLGVFRLLLPQDLMNIFHTTPCWQSKEAMPDGSTVIPAPRLPG